MDFQLAWHDFVGFIGVGLLIGAYAALQLGQIRAEAPLYSAANAVAALLILVSLVYSFNAASFVIEVFWLIISLIGLWRSLRNKAAG
jgi:hypothetical protein